MVESLQLSFGGEMGLGIDGCLASMMTIPGARRVTLVDCASGLAVAAAGREDVVDQHEDAAGATDVVRAVLASPALSATAAGDDVEEIIVCGTGGYHLLALTGADLDGHLFVHLLLDREKGNIALARLRMRDLLGEITGGRHGAGG
jgi:predicted regulator of Ras-like GTPase activity (Roadblock/LC7/MglB family)